MARLVGNIKGVGKYLWYVRLTFPAAGLPWQRFAGVGALQKEIIGAAAEEILRHGKLAWYNSYVYKFTHMHTQIRFNINYCVY